MLLTLSKGMASNLFSEVSFPPLPILKHPPPWLLWVPHLFSASQKAQWLGGGAPQNSLPLLEPKAEPYPDLSLNLGWRELSRKIRAKLGSASPFRECGELDPLLHPAVAMAQAVEEDSQRSSVLM